MSSETGKPSAEPASLPFVRPVVRQIIEGLFREQTQWKIGELVDRVVRSHRARGGSVVANPNFTISRVLRDLKDDGLVISPGHGWWRWTDASPDGPIVTEKQAQDTIPSIDEEINEIEPVVRPDKEVGDGIQWVYLHFNPNDRRLERNSKVAMSGSARLVAPQAEMQSNEYWAKVFELPCRVFQR